MKPQTRAPYVADVMPGSDAWMNESAQVAREDPSGTYVFQGTEYALQIGIVCVAVAVKHNMSNSRKTWMLSSIMPKKLPLSND